LNLAVLIDRMIAAGVSPGEAGALAAEIYAAGVASVSGRSPSATRQQRYRDRKRNESVTQRNAGEAAEGVTKRNESITNRNDVTPPSIVLEKEEKESKKEKRGAQLPDGWSPDEVRWTAACRKLGNDGAVRELQKFTSHHRAKGTVFKNWSFAWDKWLMNSADWGPKQAAGVGVVNPDTVNWRAALESYKKFNNWPRGHGNDPSSPACRAPPELLREFGLELRRMDS
jgi:hypothetical protein